MTTTATTTSTFIETVNPTNGAVLQSFPTMNAAELGTAVAAGPAAATAWGATPVADRVAAVGRLASVLRDEADELARLAQALPQRHRLGPRRRRAVQEGWLPQ